MAILKNNKNDIRNEIRDKAKKIDFKELLDNEVIKNNILEVLGYTTETPTNIYKHIDNTLEKSNKELIKQIENKINELIPNNTVKTIEDFANIKKLNQKIEEEIENLKFNISNLEYASGDGLIEKFGLEFKLNEKEEELQKNKEKFTKVYKEALKNTLISTELYEAFDEVRKIKNEIIDECEKEIELLKAKEKVVREFSKRANILEDVSIMIEDRLNSLLDTRTIVRVSEEQIPLVQALIK